MKQPLELEGTWEEILAHSTELAGRKVRLTVLPVEDEKPDAHRNSTARSLMKYAGTWVGDDLEERLREVYASRSQAEY